MSHDCSDEVKACLGALCQALKVRSIEGRDLPMIEAWTLLPRFSVARFRLIVEQTLRERGKINSARYFDPIITEAFSAPARPDLPPRPRVLVEQEWGEYLVYLTDLYGEPDAPLREFWRDRWEVGRRRLGLPIDEEGDVSRETVDPVSTG